MDGITEKLPEHDRDSQSEGTQVIRMAEGCDEADARDESESRDEGGRATAARPSRR